MDTQTLSAPSYPWSRVRRAHYDQIYISPHMDDAVYSCGGQIALERAAGKHILIVTVFGDGHADLTRDTSQHGVFGDYQTRRREERAAADVLDVDHLWLNQPDLLVRPKQLGELLRYGLPFTTLRPSSAQSQLHVTVAALCTRLLAPGGLLFFPLAIGAHPDHRIVHAVGRALAASARWPTSFYEDIPYAQVPALREERLHHLGLPPGLDGVGRAAIQVHDFVFAHAPRWQRPLTRLLVLGHALVVRTLFKLFGDKQPLLQGRALVERKIDSVLETKLAAVRAYVTQTAFFFPAGKAINGVLARSGAHYVERYWTLTPGQGERITEPDAAALERELARVDALIAGLS